MTLIPETPAEFDTTRVFERPDGFYWQNKETGEEFGPFPTLMDAVKDMEYSVDADVEAGEGAQEAERDLGIADWVDEETGLPAEDSVPHIEDH